jgi:hypothetical protein
MRSHVNILLSVNVSSRGRERIQWKILADLATTPAHQGTISAPIRTVAREPAIGDRDAR